MAITRRRLFTITSAAFALCLVGVPVVAQSVTEEHWARYYIRFRPVFAAVDGELFCLPKYDPAFESSAHENVAQWKRDNTEELGTGAVASFVKNRTLVPAEQEVYAACRSLPEIAPGEYGRIEWATVEKVIDHKTMIVSRITLVDPAEVDRQRRMDTKRLEDWHDDQREARSKENRERRRSGDDRVEGVEGAKGSKISRNRVIMSKRFEVRDELQEEQARAASTRVIVHGELTRGLRTGSRWRPRTAIGLLGFTNPDGEGRMLVAMPTRLLGNDVTETLMLRYLDAKNISKQEFVETARTYETDDPIAHRLETLRALGLDNGADQANRRSEASQRREARRAARQAKAAARELQTEPTTE